MMGLLDLVVGSALGPVGSLGMKVVKSDKFWKGLLVLALVAAIWFGFSSYRAMAGELATTQEELAGAEEAWLATQAEVEEANKESRRLNTLLASVNRDKTLLKRNLSARLDVISELEKSLEESEFKTCLSVPVPTAYAGGLYGTE